ncbi:MAG: alpha/beta fold hydrolase [Myxococcales bacterium]|nr:alpha/beta fold hydrolase [Myxococcales bacterium]
MSTTLEVLERRGPGDMHVAELGTGPRVVFVHGGGAGGLASWQAQLPLAARWRLVAPSRPGYGASPSDAGEDFLAHAGPIAELLGSGAHVVGHSYGAVVAMFAAAQRPEAVSSLTLVEAASSAIARGKPGVDDYERRMGELARNPPADLDERVRGVFAILDPTVPLPSPMPPPLRAWAARMSSFRWPWEAEVPIAALRAGGFPILAISGGERRLYEEISDGLAEKLGAERRIVPGSHAVQAAGAPFNDVLEAFWQRAELRARPTRPLAAAAEVAP